MATPYSLDPTLYLYTSLTAGSSHLITATSRLETILKANKITFRALDVATDEKARMLWGRRSKGRKLPGLVKYGEIIGDLEQIEDWNEYGELKDQIGSVSGLGVPASSTPSKPPESTLPVPTSEPQSRSSSETRHISISDPKDVPEPEKSPDTVQKKDDSPLTMAMRQAGAEAAAKAGQKKSSKAVPTGSSATATAVPDELKSEITKTTAPTTDPQLSASASDPSATPAITAAKAPAQLAAEGAKRTSIDKIAESGSSGSESTSPTKSTPNPFSAGSTKDLSNEEQVLSLHRNSSITKTPSRLSSQVAPEDVSTAQETVGEDTGGADEEKDDGSRPSVTATRNHRGSSISGASKEEIAAIEKSNAIPEEDSEAAEDEDDVNRAEDGVTTKTVTATDEVEKKVMAEQPQDQAARDADKAGDSVAD